MADFAFVVAAATDAAIAVGRDLDAGYLGGLRVAHVECSKANCYLAQAVEN